MTVDTKVEYVLMGSRADFGVGEPFVLRRDADETRIMPTAKARREWDTLAVQRVTTVRTVDVIKAWRKGVEADDA